MDKKTTGIIATLVAVLLCGCPGLVSLCMGFMFAVVSQIPGADIDIGGSNDPQQAMMVGLGALCLGLIFVIIPVVVGFLTLRNKPEAVTFSNPGDPLPPAI